MADQYTIAQVSKMSGLASHTLRYYERQFPGLLNVGRTKGGHRIYRQHHVDAIKTIVSLLKEEKVSIKQARELLGETQDDESVAENLADQSSTTETGAEHSEIEQLLVQVLKRLDNICQNNQKRDLMIQRLLENGSAAGKEDLLRQIGQCRHETRETMRLYQALMTKKTSENHKGLF